MIPANCHTYTLANGLRVIHEQTDSPVVYCGYVMRVGTRHEQPAESGMAHFIEHLTFKGTHRRRAWQISNGLERVGGELNAYTTKQETVYCATVLRPDFARAVDLLTDIVFHSTYPQTEIDREVEVICDEIDSFKDSPSELIFDEFESLVFEGCDLGRDILGEADRLRQYRTADALRFTRAHYRPDNAVFYIYGNVDFRRAVRQLERLMATAEALPSPQAPVPTACTLALPPARTVYRDRGTHQAHVLLGCPTYGGRHPRRFALLLLNNILGGPGMNARLNMLMRERAGLVYTVESNYATYVDVGLWTVYFGCDADDVDRCLRMVRRELQRMIDQPLTARQLAAAKKQFIGQIGISREARESYAISLGKTYAHYDTWRDLDALAQAVSALTSEELQATAAEVFAADRLSLLVYTTSR
ncbi:MAG: pitrilysin family protein [Alloprevotella sp.]|nr:pitrilysin family protein [Alloprevotella sp.]